MPWFFQKEREKQLLKVCVIFRADFASRNLGKKQEGKSKAVELKKVAAVDQIRLPCLLSSARVSRRVDESGSM